MSGPAHTPPEVGSSLSENETPLDTNGVPPGHVLRCGKTGSGKTTSLGPRALYPYSLEEPVEHPLRGLDASVASPA